MVLGVCVGFDVGQRPGTGVGLSNTSTAKLHAFLETVFEAT